MKKYIFISLMVSSFAFAQQPPILSTTSLANPADDMKIGNSGNYAVDTGNERDQYVGTWEYNQNGVLFQINIQKVDQVLNKVEYQGNISYYSYCDEVVLRYKLVKNGVVVYDNLNTPIGQIINSTSFGIKQFSSNDMRGRFLDYTRNVVGTYTITKLSTATPTIIFNLRRGAYTLQNPSTYYDDGQPLFSIPMEGIEMIKIN